LPASRTPSIWRHPLAMPFVILTVVSIFGLVPPFSRDALNDHLMLPILWEHYGFFWRDTALGFTAYPPLADMPYILFAGHSWDWAASLWHALGAAVTLIYLNRAMRNLHVSISARRTALLSWAICPAVVSLATWCYVDLWLCAFAAVATDILTRPLWKNSDTWLLGLVLGLAMLTKYNAAPLVLGLLMALLWRWGKVPGQAVRHGLLSLGVCLLVAGWWYIGNWMMLGAPFYPLGEGGGGTSWLRFRMLGYQEAFGWAAVAPLRQFFWGEVNNPRLFDGMLHPLWLVAFAFPFFWRHNRRISALLLACLVYITFAVSTSIRARYWLPGMTLALPLTGLMLMRARNAATKSVVAMSFAPPLVACALYLFALHPWHFWLHGRDAFLQRMVPDYAISRWAASHLPFDSHVYLLWNAGRAYYLGRSYGVDFVREGATLRAHLNHKEEFEYTHILMRRDLADRTLGEDFPERWKEFLAGSCRVAKAGAYELWKISPCPGKNGA